jgi:hypothetical protein
MYYVWNVGFTIFLIVMLSSTTWSINPTIVGERLAVTLTLVLALIAFKFAISTTIPKVPYLTYLDKYFIMAFMMLSIVAAENSLCAHIGEDAWDDRPNDIQNSVDRWFFIIFMSVWFIINIVFLTCALTGKFFLEWNEIEQSDESRTFPQEPDSGNFQYGGGNNNMLAQVRESDTTVRSVSSETRQSPLQSPNGKRPFQNAVGPSSKTPKARVSQSAGKSKVRNKLRSASQKLSLFRSSKSGPRKSSTGTPNKRSIVGSRR